MQTIPDTAILRLPEVKKRTGLPTSTLYYFMSKGEFPSSHKIGHRAVGWLQSDVDAWIKSKISKSGDVK
ncbi:MAG: AlpA family transcriptional regulator [Micavibrio sp.]|nr:AlpA family transcriptional regulator [Micavibrio sp.]MBK9562501.1 AlpA family transcriptional regulator [Micavibrio sp.]